MRLTVIIVCLAVLVGCDSSPKAAEGNAPAAPNDPRTPVSLPADGQQAVLQEMRQMLGAMGGALTGAARGDTAAVLAALAPAGSAAAADPALEALLPGEWKELAERTHGGFDTLVTGVRYAHTPSALKDTVLVGLARITGSCTACHETFRITISEPRK
jgi:cytochrome c556